MLNGTTEPNGLQESGNYVLKSSSRPRNCLVSIDDLASSKKQNELPGVGEKLPFRRYLSKWRRS